MTVTRGMKVLGFTFTTWVVLAASSTVALILSIAFGRPATVVILCAIMTASTAVNCWRAAKLPRPDRAGGRRTNDLLSSDLRTQVEADLSHVNRIPAIIIGQLDMGAWTLYIEPWGNSHRIEADEYIYVRSNALLTGDIEVHHTEGGLVVAVRSDDPIWFVGKSGRHYEI